MAKTMIMDHALIKHKISLLRDENTGTRDFRLIVEEIAALMAYEVFRDLPLEEVTVKTPVSTAKTVMLAGKKPAVVPVLRAGLGMVNGLLSVMPSAKVGHIGLSRDESTHLPREYYSNLPGHIEERLVIVPDPMLATGGSAIHAVDFLKSKGCKDIRFMCIIAAPEGLDALRTAHPDIDIYVGQLDEGLNENAYIVPGLGDAGQDIRNKTVTKSTGRRHNAASRCFCF